ncbi:MAG: DUF2520 domain-containing protein [Lachnospiraceae bacterium]|nr:DUF2520 domain-containing protein [Lachnospiraceae bacterium]
MKLGFIGAGKVGTTLGKVFSEAGLEVVGFYSRTKESAEESATFTGTKLYDDAEDLVKASDTLFITVSDAAIKDVWDYIARFDIKNKIICHCSGALSSDIFKDSKNSGAHVCSIHPIFAFSDKFSIYKQFNNVNFTLEGDSEAVSTIEELLTGLGHKVRIIPSDKKVLYHAAMVYASNLVVGIINESVELLKECDFSEEEGYLAIEKLAKTNLDSVFARGCEGALTGPVERGDYETVNRHRDAINGLICDEEKKNRYLEVYDNLSQECAVIAENKRKRG